MFYSIEQNGTWSKPPIVSDDGKADFSPQMKEIDGEIYVTWENSNTTYFGGTTMQDMLHSQDIYVAKLDKAQGIFVDVSQITNNDKLNAAPFFADSTDGDVVVMYQTNTENDPFGISGTNKLNAVSYDGIKCNSINTNISTTKPLLDMSAIVNNGELKVAYVVDNNGDLQSIENRNLYLSQNGKITQITNSKSPTTSPKWMTIDNQVLLTYIQDGKINYVDGINNNKSETVLLLPSTVDKFEINYYNNQPIISFLDTNNDGNHQITLSMYDRQNKIFLSPFAISNSENDVDQYLLLFNSSDIEFVYSQKHKGDDERVLYTTIEQDIFNMEYDISLDNVIK